MAKIPENYYGSRTVARPVVVKEMPNGPTPNCEKTLCPYCGGECWKTDAERLIADQTNLTFACTPCAVHRGIRQLEMDQKRYDKEIANLIPPII